MEKDYLKKKSLQYVRIQFRTRFGLRGFAGNYSLFSKSLDQIGFANFLNLERMKTIYCQEDVKYMGTLLRNTLI